jgi:transcriptional regulator with XRE-family HTH domain
MAMAKTRSPIWPDSTRKVDNVEIGREIFNRRRLAGLTIRELAKMAGVSKTYLGYMETGKRSWEFKGDLYKQLIKLLDKTKTKK